MVVAFLSFLSFLVAVIIIIVVAKQAYNSLKRNARSLKFPPGPNPKFLIGNALDFPKGDVGRVFAQWGKKYNSAV
jgi:hypothetical protein